MNQELIQKLDEMENRSKKIINKLKELKKQIERILTKQEVNLLKTMKESKKTLSKYKLTDEQKEQTEKLNIKFEEAKKNNDYEELERIQNKYEELIKIIITELNSDINNLMSSIERNILKIQDKDKTQIIKEEYVKIREKNEANINDSIDQKLEKLEKLKSDLEEMNISRFGKIKVFIKIKPNSSDEIKIDGESKIINGFLRINNDETIVINDNDKFGKFSKVLFKLDGGKNVIKNKDLFEEISGSKYLEKIPKDFSLSEEILKSPLHINNLLGRSTILFGYGISGSGKSWTFFGGKKDGNEDVGLIKLLISSISTMGVKVTPFKIFEHYLDETSNFIESDGSLEPHFIENKLKSKIRDFEIKDYLSDESYSINFDKLEKYRTKIFSLKKTPNNDKSSRTNLFIIYKITKGKDVGYITFIDSAGKEEPLEIAKQFYTKTSGGGEIQNPSLPFISKDINFRDASFTRFNFEYFSNGKSLTDDEKKEIYKTNLNYVKNIIREGFFINESFAHMISYFTEENIVQKNKEKKINGYKSYNEGKLSVFYKPPATRKIGKVKELEDSNNEDPILITTIFEYLTNLCSEKDDKTKKFRFIMLGNIQTEKKYKDDIIKTLKLVDFLKSN
jgi:hypothetical protein